MKLDRTRIVIRERGFLDLLDLALFVIRGYAGPLVLALAAGIAPMLLLNAWLLADLAQTDVDMDVSFGYLLAMLLLVMWEAPFATGLATLYLGESIFTERPHVRSLLGMYVRSLPQLFLYQGLVRGLLIPWVVTWFLPFAVRPYLNEVILLERNPLRARRAGQMTTNRRAKSLHHGNVSNLFGSWLVLVAFGGVLFASLWVSMQVLAGMLLNEWEWQGLTFTLYYPLALWIVAAYFAVVRFLGYLDLRIRREGWEIELMMRTEGERLTRQLS